MTAVRLSGYLSYLSCRFAVCLVIGICLSHLGLSSAVAQGRIMGRITDESGNPIPAATISLTAGGLAQAALTNAQGYYAFLSVPQGDYTIRVIKRDARAQTASVSVVPGRMVRFDVMLPSLTTLAIVTAGDDGKNEFKSESKPEPRPPKRPDQKPRPAPPVKPPPVAVKTAPPADSLASKPVATKVDTPVSRPVATKVDTLASGEIADGGLKQAVKDAEVTEASERVKVDVRPQVQGGLDAIARKLIYPEVTRASRLQGSVVAKVFIKESGEVTKVTILKSPHPAFSEEVFRVLSEDVRFSPAQAGRKNVAGTAVILVAFTLAE
ncbi:MAG: TonB family protein [Rhizobacter sp.]|nr:TonB family protein [Chlorobiales bacterium]